MSRSLAFLFPIIIFLAACCRIGAAAEKPNFVWLISEDNSQHYLKLFDEHGAPTPNIAALARDGVVFERAFSNAPVCSVARTTLITGCYAPRIGTQFHRRLKPAPMPEGLSMFPAYLRAGGYYTTNNQKKDYNAIEGDGVWDESSKKALWRKRPNKDQPFFHMQSFTASHESSLHFSAEQMKRGGLTTSPREITLPPYFPDTPTFRYTMARYHDRIGEIDRQIGQVVAQLKEDGLLESTFIFYFGDHGGVLPRSKGYLYESGLHVPLVVRVPEKFKHLVTLKRGSRTKGFVSFIDFGPTLLHLAGIDVPEQVDGQPFLGPDISPDYLAKRDTTYGYADRFDEKYDLVRSVRQGRFKYIRNYQPHFPDGLQNNYRYQMLAYAQWRNLYGKGELNETQRQFFLPKSPEALYDLQSDPYEVSNLAGDPQHHKTLQEMRGLLQQWVKSMPDLSFYPESFLIEHAMANPVAFGQEHKGDIASLVDIADLSLLPYDQAKPRLAKALASSAPWPRYWAFTTCTSFALKGQGEDFAADARKLLKDDNLMVRLRAAEFLGTRGDFDPQPVLSEILNTTDSPVEALITLNTVVYFTDCAPKRYPFDLKRLKMKVKAGEVQRRIDYLRGRSAVEAGGSPASPMPQASRLWPRYCSRRAFSNERRASSLRPSCCCIRPRR